MEIKVSDLVYIGGEFNIVAAIIRINSGSFDVVDLTTMRVINNVGEKDIEVIKDPNDYEMLRGVDVLNLRLSALVLSELRKR